MIFFPAPFAAEITAVKYSEYLVGAMIESCEWYTAEDRILSVTNTADMTWRNDMTARLQPRG